MGSKYGYAKRCAQRAKRSLSRSVHGKESQETLDAKATRLVQLVGSSQLVRAALLSRSPVPAMRSTAAGAATISSWRCSSCRKPMTSTTHVGHHTCRGLSGPRWTAPEMAADGLLEARRTAQGQEQQHCKLCAQRVGARGTHMCRSTAITSYTVDWSSLERTSTDWGRPEEACISCKLRGMSGHVVVVSLGVGAQPHASTEQRQGVEGYQAQGLVRTHLLLAPSRLKADAGQSVGQGAYAVHTLVAEDSSASDRRTADEDEELAMAMGGAAGSDTRSPLPLSRQLVGWYTGKVVSGADLAASGTDASLAITGATAPDGSTVFRDPDLSRGVGGVMVLLNQAHGKSANTEARHVMLRGLPYVALMARSTVHSGDELLWDYGATTDDRRDPLLMVKCVCGDKECTGRLLMYQGPRASRRSSNSSSSKRHRSS